MIEKILFTLHPNRRILCVRLFKFSLELILPAEWIMRVSWPRAQRTFWNVIFLSQTSQLLKTYRRYGNLMSTCGVLSPCRKTTV